MGENEIYFFDINQKNAHNCHRFKIIFLKTLVTSHTATHCSNLLCNKSVHYAYSLHRRNAFSFTYARDQNIVQLLFYAIIDVLSDDGPVTSKICKSVVPLKILL
jgi:hypothetical protein